MYSNRIVRSASQINDAMLAVYMHMTLAVITSMIVSVIIGYNHAAMALLFGTPLKWVVIFAPLVAIIGISYVLANDPPKSTALAMLHGFAAIMGVSCSIHFGQYLVGFCWRSRFVWYNDFLRILYQTKFGQHWSVSFCWIDCHNYSQSCQHMVTKQCYAHGC